ncbi:MAG TPA: PDZ domain-containing protein [Thermoanaerobaculia bacterium]|nr:PDZ domain-containing protein [Thermoanaerobaculia bacterium]
MRPLFARCHGTHPADSLPAERPAAIRFPALLLTAALLAAAPWATPAAAWQAPSSAEPASAPGAAASASEAPPLAAEPGLREELRGLIGRARDRVFPALVNIEVVRNVHYEGREYKQQTFGSGTIVTAEGHVLTNYHVTAEGERFTCTLADRRELPCRLTGEDPLTDLAVLRLDLATLPEGERRLRVATLGDSARLEVGDYVLAMGSPFALSRSVTLGIVSNVERVFAGGMGSDDPDEMEVEPGQRTGLFTRWIQHDALIHPGNSGGPLVDLAGEVVGVNELGGSAIGFAIPSNLARQVADQLIAHGEVERSWIGVSFRPVEETGYTRGVLVDAVVADGPAGQAGLAAGDLLVALEGEPVTVRFPEETPVLAKRIADLPVGTRLALTYERDGEEHSVELVTEVLERDRGEQATLRDWGLSVQGITRRLADEARIEPGGVMVTGVRPGSAAQLAEPSLASGDVLRRVDGEAVAGLDDLLARYAELAPPGGEAAPVLVDFERRGRRLVTSLEPRDGTLGERPRELPKGWIGIATQPMTGDLAERLTGGRRGFRITRVYPGTEAAAADLAVGDVIVALEEEALEPRGAADTELFARRVARLPIGGTATLAVLRDGTEREVTLLLERSRITPEEARRVRDGDFELVVRELTFFDRDERRWDDEVRGVLVEQVEPAGWAGLGGLRYGDLVQRIGDRQVRGLASFEEAMAEVARERPERAVFVVLRGGRTRFLFVEPAWEPLTADPAGGDPHAAPSGRPAEGAHR